MRVFVDMSGQLVDDLRPPTLVAPERLGAREAFMRQDEFALVAPLEELDGDEGRT